MKAYEVFFTEDSKIYIEAENIHYENDTNDGVRMVYLTIPDGNWWKPIAMFNLANIIGIHELGVIIGKEDK